MSLLTHLLFQIIIYLDIIRHFSYVLLHFLSIRGIRSSAVEQRTAVPSVTGSIPVGSFFISYVTLLDDCALHSLPSYRFLLNVILFDILFLFPHINTFNSLDYRGFHGVGAAYEILVLRTPVRFWVEPFLQRIIGLLR